MVDFLAVEKTWQWWHLWILNWVSRLNVSCLQTHSARGRGSAVQAGIRQIFTEKSQISSKIAKKMKFHLFIPAKSLRFLLKFWDLSGVKIWKSCRSRKMLQNDYLVAIVAVHTAENEPLKILRWFHSFFNRLLTQQQWSGCPALQSYAGVFSGAETKLASSKCETDDKVQALESIVVRGGTGRERTTKYPQKNRLHRRLRKTQAWGGVRRSAHKKNSSMAKNKKRALDRWHCARATSEPPFIAVLIGIATCDPLRSRAANQPAQPGKKGTKSQLW
jgi:hypothetical protein